MTSDLESVREAKSNEVTELGPGQVGNILVRGSPCFSGYEVSDDEYNGENDDCFFTVDKQPGWFCTGSRINHFMEIFAIVILKVY